MTNFVGSYSITYVALGKFTLLNLKISVWPNK